MTAAIDTAPAPRQRFARRHGRRFVASRVHPVRFQRRYMRVLSRLMSGWGKLAQGLLVPAVSPYLRLNAVGDIGSALESLRAQLFGAMADPQLALDLQDIADDVQRYQGAQIRDAFSVGAQSAAASLLGLDVGSLTDGAEEKLVTWTTKNVGLIESVAEDFLAEVQTEVMGTFAEGERAEDLADRIAERFGVSQSRAELIAIDQVGKLNGTLNRDRQTDLGIEKYIWRTAGDDRVREEHEDRDGEVFSWSDPPEDGHPGDPVRCRCYADPVMPEELN